MTRNEAAQILGISPQANENTIKKAFRKKAMKLHPDRNKASNARSQFIQVHEAYEYLSDLATGRTTETYSRSTRTSQSKSASKFRSANHKHRHYADPYEHMSREEFEERYERARRAANEDRKATAIHSNALDEYQTTWRRPFAKYMAVVGLVLALLFTADFFLGTITEDIPSEEVEIIKIKDSRSAFYYINIHHVKYSLSNQVRFFIKKNEVNYRIKRTYIFKDIIEINISNSHHYIDLAPDYSSYGTFPFIPLLLLIPLLSFWFERPSFNFVFFVVYYNIYIFPIITLVLLFHDGRLLRLFGF